MDNQQTQKTNNETVYVYPAGIGLDEDIVLKEEPVEVLNRSAFIAETTVSGLRG